MQRTILFAVALAATGCSKADRDRPAASDKATEGAGLPLPRESSPLVGKPAPDFTLDAIDGSRVTLSALRGKTVVLEWFNPECAVVRRAHEDGSLVDAARRARAGGVLWLAINSTGFGKQGYEPALSEDAHARWSLAHPILRDPGGQVGHAYGATTTPELFVIDPAGTVVYAGAVDNAPDGARSSALGGTLVDYAGAALADVAAGRPVATPVTKPYGCAVKYAP